jgi:hypothetical protein
VKRLRIDFDRPSALYVGITPEVRAALDAVEDQDDWQPLIDLLYYDIEAHFMSNFYIDDIKELEH